MHSLRDAGAELVVPVLAKGSCRCPLAGAPKGRPALQRRGPSAAPPPRPQAGRRAPAGRGDQSHATQARERERITQELRVARIIQQQFLPAALPEVPGWRIGTVLPAGPRGRGDFYDFLHLPDGRFGVVIGDVSDKGVPAALVMATTRSLLREVAQQLVEPAAVLERVNRTSTTTSRTTCS